MRYPAALLALAMLAGCSLRPPAVQPEPDFVHYEYHFAGQLGAETVSGSLRFDRVDAYNIDYTLSSDRGLCTRQLPRTAIRNVTLRCEGLAFDFTRAGVVRSQANATLVTTVPVQRRECAQWITRSGQRVCTGWRNVTVDRTITHRGTLRIEQHDPDGWTGPASG